MNDEVLTEGIPQEHSFAPLGEVLSAARKAKKLSEQDVSNSLRLSIKQISDIESNNFSTLPQPMITRGFIRNYARLLELDAEPLLNSYRARVPDAAPKSVSVQSSMYQVVSGKESQPWLKYILGSILILLFLLAWIFYVDYIPKAAKGQAEKSAESVVVAPPTTELPLPEIALPAAERQADASDVTTGTDAANNQVSANDSQTSTTAASVSSAASSSTANAGANSAAVSGSTTNVAAAAPSNSTVATNEVAKATENKSNTPVAATVPQAKVNTAVDFNALKEKAAQAGQAVNAQTSANKAQTITVAPNQAAASNSTNTDVMPAKKVSITNTEKSWVQATDKSGKVVYERILPAGSTDGFDGQPPFNVVIGNAKATKLLFLGKPIDLVSNTTENNVARIKLE